MKKTHFFLLVVIAIGILLRFVDVTIPDLATDEAQFALGASAAQPPLGMLVYQMTQGMFGHTIVTVRGTSIVFGILSIILIFRIAKTFLDEETALLASGIAAIFPSHIFFSRLAYLSVPLVFFWLLLLFVFLKTRKNPTPFRLIALFLASVAVTLVKTQGLLFPLFLLIGTLVKNRKLTTNNYQLITALVLSLVPISLYILTHPGIAATVMLYGGNMYGLSGIFQRLADLLATWWSMCGLFLIAIPMSLFAWKKCPWPLIVLIFIGAGIGLVLGPGHAYYSTDLLPLAIPIAMTLMMLPRTVRHMATGALLAVTILLLGPAHLSPYSHELFQEEGFWNQFAGDVNDVLKEEEAVTVLGDAGHHLRWYLEPRVLVGKDMEPPYPTKYVILLGPSEVSNVRGKIVWVSEEVAMVRQDFAAISQ